MKLLSKLFNYVLLTSKKYNIDESHGIIHSMNVLHYAKKIYNCEIEKNPNLINDKNVIYSSIILHDMCDKKYIDETKGTNEIVNYLNENNMMSRDEIEAVKNIITTMSYSKVKKYGFPKLKKYQPAYHIVREADLLTSYDFDRAIIYDMCRNNSTIYEAYENSVYLFIKRVFQYNNDNLFIHEFSKKESMLLHDKSIERMKEWKEILF
jgi:HD superfamily phosphodiesterase